MRSTAERITNLAAAVIVMLAVVAFAAKWQASGDDSLRSLPITYRNASHTLVVFVQEHCPYCTDSFPFYRRILQTRQARKASLQVAFAAPNLRITDYLTAQHVTPDTVVAAPPGSVPVKMTPTLVLVDRNGGIRKTWVGKLTAEQETDAMAWLFD